MWSDGLRERLRSDDPPALCVAFSGGPDSTALLHALAHAPEARERGLRALHVDHGLHAESVGWAQHCAEFCKTLDVPLTAARVEVRDARGEGTEAAARHARYAAFTEHLGDCEWLVLAHHRDDQIETVLLKLLRGAGPEGLGGMRPLRPFARGFLWRPLLDTPRADLRGYLASHDLPHIDDPANDDPRFSRNILRNQIIPRIARHWPHAGASILHTARLCREAAGYLERQAQTALTALRREAETLDANGWLALPDALRAPVLDAWLHARKLPAPPDSARAELERQAADAAEDRAPMIAWAGAEVRVWDGRLHATPPLGPPASHWRSAWSGEPLALPEGCGALTLEPANRDSTTHGAARFNPPLIVQFRRGGERIRPAGDAHTRELRDLFQQARIPPWWRARCPLIYQEGELIAIAGLWVSARGKALFDAHGAQPFWMASVD